MNFLTKQFLILAVFLVCSDHGFCPPKSRQVVVRENDTQTRDAQEKLGEALSATVNDIMAVADEYDWIQPYDEQARIEKLRAAFAARCAQSDWQFFLENKLPTALGRWILAIGHFDCERIKKFPDLLFADTIVQVVKHFNLNHCQDECRRLFFVLQNVFYLLITVGSDFNYASFAVFGTKFLISMETGLIEEITRGDEVIWQRPTPEAEELPAPAAPRTATQKRRARRSRQKEREAQDALLAKEAAAAARRGS